MKKLTKTLSLVLVIAMVVSLCVVGASAKTFSDYKAPTTGTDYTEAIDVMSGVGIIDGMNGGFNAAGNFTRAQAAKIIAYMQLGVTKAEALSFNTNTAVIFSDVPTTFWAYNYIEYCAQQGIITGYGNGKFGPNDTLTGYQWAKMLLSAVGFGVNKEYNGVNWAINAARDGLKYGVFTAKVDATAGSTPKVITRDVATGMAFNTLVGIPKVTYAALIGDYIDGTGNVFTGNSIKGITTNGTLAVSVFKLYAESGRITYLPSKAAFKVAVGNSYYDAPAATYDVYGYAAHVWAQGTKTITEKTYIDSVKVGDVQGSGAGLYNKTNKTGYLNPASATYVASADESNMVVVKTGSPYTTTATATNAASTAYTYGLNNVAITVNNVDAAANGKATVRGVATTLLDDDGDGDVDTVAYLVKNVFTLTSKPVTKTVNGVDYVKVVGVMDDFVKASMADGYKDLVKGDTVLWFVDCTGTYHFAKAAEVTGTYTGSTTVNGLTSYKIGDKSQPLSQLNVGDSDSTKTYGAPLYTGTEATYYTDDFGYWCGDKAVAVDNTVYVLAAGYSQLTGLQAKVLFAETGKVDTITVASVNGGVSEPDANTVDKFGLKSSGDDNCWYTAQKTAAGSYVLTPVKNGTTNNDSAYYMRNNAARFLTDTDPSTAAKAEYWTGDGNTKVFVQQADGSFVETVGVLNAPVCTVNGYIGFTPATAYDQDYSYVSHVVVLYDKTNVMKKDTANVYFYGMSPETADTAYNSINYVNGVAIYNVNAIVKGEVTTKNVTASVYKQLCAQPGLYIGTVSSNDVIVALGTFAPNYGTGEDTCGSAITQTGDVVMKDTVLKIDGTPVYGAYDSTSVKIYYVKPDGNLETIATEDNVAELNSKGALEGALVCWTYDATNVDLITSVVIYSPEYAATYSVAAPTAVTTAINGLNVQSVTAKVNGLDVQGVTYARLGDTVTYTVTVAGTATDSALSQNVVATAGANSSMTTTSAAVTASGTFTFKAVVNGNVGVASFVMQAAA